MAFDGELADRIRYALSDEPSVREVKMFGGLSFMVNGRLSVGANGAGGLLLRCDPEGVDDLGAREGVRSAEMGAGRKMSKGWIVIGAEEVSNDEDLNLWIGLALRYNNKVTGGEERTPADARSVARLTRHEAGSPGVNCTAMLWCPLLSTRTSTRVLL